ncbi:MAG: nickel pincer cofactor biosynthesis protein LarC [Candidatus Bathyarchaeia archaeon]
MSTANKIVVIDSQIAGIAGDMLLAALLDLGANKDKVTSAIYSLEQFGYQNINIEIKKVMRKEFQATTIDVTAKTSPHLHGCELIKIVETCTEQLNLSQKAKQFALNVINTLVGAEAKMHNTNLEHAHLHEVGLVDTAAEIVGSAVALDDLELFDSKIVATPVSVGGGLFKFSHGIVSSPAPATLLIFQSKQFPIKGGPIETELATPTGASIIVNLADETTSFYPAMVPTLIGYGAGTKNFQELPNVLRIAVGKPLDYGLTKEEIAVLETNLDDVTGETLGHAIDVLLQEGAKDVNIIPAVTKKSRPSHIVKVTANKQDVERLSRVLMDETGTLGVRVYPCQRHVINREVLQVELTIGGTKESVTIKVAKDHNGSVVNIKPEFEDVKRIANKLKKPLRQVNELILMQTKQVVFPKTSDSQ